jgi:hypothetical protein
VSSTNKGKKHKKNNRRGSENTKMNKSKKRPNEQVTFLCAHIQKDQRQLSPGGMMTKEQGQLLGIKEWTKGKSKNNWPPIAQNF